jgi:HD-GYP domain-containing protein (c-di-GMP phosphodiesterase class II)
MEQKPVLEGLFEAMGKLAETNNTYKKGHHRKVAALAKAISGELGFSPDFASGIWAAGIVHDIGEILVPIDILCKATKLTHIEFMLLKDHPRNGYDVLKEIDFPWPVAETVLQHHERIDGSGYPGGLKGNAVGQQARILGVADVVVAMLSDRPFRYAMSLEKTFIELTKGMAGMLDVDAVDACVALLSEKGFEF